MANRLAGQIATSCELHSGAICSRALGKEVYRTGFWFAALLVFGAPVLGQALSRNPSATQTAAPGAPYGTKMVVTALDTNGKPVAGVVVTFRAPALSGASGTFLGAPAGIVCTETTHNDGTASALAFTANGITGTYDVVATATVDGKEIQTSFNMDNAKAAPSTSAWSSRYTRAYVGLAVADASGAPSAAQLLLGIDTELPLTTDVDFWMSPRISSLTQANSATSAGLVDGTFFTTALSSGSPTQLAQSFDFSAGPAIEFNPAPATSKANDAKFVVAEIASFGVTTPIAPNNLASSSVVYDNAAPNPTPGMNCDGSPLAQSTSTPPPKAPAMCPAVFVPESRNRFFYRYNAGFRFETFNYDATGNLENHYPGTFDVTVGQDETVSGGRAKGVIVRLEANYPIPFVDSVNVFGTLAMAPFSGTQTTSTVLLVPDSTMTAFSAGVQRVNVPAPSADYFVLGLAFDLSKLKH